MPATVHPTARKPRRPQKTTGKCAERWPVPWCNATADGAVPPPFLYARHCVSYDRAVDWGAPPRAAPPRRADEQCAAVARGMQVALPRTRTLTLKPEPEPEP